MKETERGTKEFPPCGYGVLGLCCQACLLGPCRLTPFGEESERGRCGDDRDRIVARNLLRLAVLEAPRSMKDLLLPFPGKAGSCLSSLYPEGVFPSIYHIFREGEREGGFPLKSLVGLLLDSAHIGQDRSSGVEEILNQSLRISVLAMASDALQSSLSCREGDRQLEEDLKLSEALDRLPSTPCPLLIEVSEGDDAPHPMTEERLKKLEGVTPVISVKKRQALSEIGRKLSEKWNLPTEGLRTVVLISSERVTSTLGALGLGFSVASFPPLPIHGSDRTEAFFFTNLKKRTGNRYLPSWRPELDSMITERLKG